jgi:hypothetical protein
MHQTVGGNLIDSPDNVITKTVGLTTAKILFNSVISTPHAKCMSIDLKHFYLNTPLDCYDYEDADWPHPNQHC